MHRPHSTLRNFSVRGLLAAGALASLGLPLGREACGIGGSAIQPTFGPRDNAGAIPVVSLIPSGPSSSSMVAASGGGGGEISTPGGSSGGRTTHHVSSDDEGHGTTRKRRRKTADQGEGTRVAKRDTYEAKDYKETAPAPIIAPPAKPMFSLSTGFESRYIYHGVDIVGFNSAIPSISHGIDISRFLGASFNDAPKSNATSPVLYLNGNTEFKGLHLGVGYIYAIDPTEPSRTVLENQAASLNRFFGYYYNTFFGAGKNPFPSSQYKNNPTHYQEVDINLDYTLSIIANVLDATAGYNSYIIPDHEFKGTNYQGEAFGRLTYKQIPYLQPSITYFRYISDARGEAIILESITPTRSAFITRNEGEYLNGNYVEARIDSAIPLLKKTDFSASFSPYALVSLNDGYLTKTIDNDTHVEFNTVEVGAKLPLAVGAHFDIIPYVNYGFDVSHYHESNDFRGSIAPFKEDVWGGITFSYRF